MVGGEDAERREALVRIVLVLFLVFVVTLFFLIVILIEIVGLVTLLITRTGAYALPLAALLKLVPVPE